VSLDEFSLPDRTGCSASPTRRCSLLHAPILFERWGTRVGLQLYRGIRDNNPLGSFRLWCEQQFVPVYGKGVRRLETALCFLSVVPPHAQRHPPKRTEHEGFNEDVDEEDLENTFLSIHVHPVEANRNYRSLTSGMAIAVGNGSYRSALGTWNGFKRNDSD